MFKNNIIPDIPAAAAAAPGDGVCVFCGASSGSGPAFVKAAEELGALLAKHGLPLVYGGGAIGLMGAVARGALAAGGHVTGVIPEFLQTREIAFTGASEMIVTSDMHTRKQVMFERAGAFIALPGGVGTLEELVEQLTWAQLGRHKRPILLLNTDGFWDPFLQLLDHMRISGFLRPHLDVTFQVAREPVEAVAAIRSAMADIASNCGTNARHATPAHG